MLMDWNDRYECYEEKCPVCGYVYAETQKGDAVIGDEPFLEAQKHNRILLLESEYENNEKRYGCTKPIHICPKCGTMGIQVG